MKKALEFVDLVADQANIKAKSRRELFGLATKAIVFAIELGFEFDFEFWQTVPKWWHGALMDASRNGQGFYGENYYRLAIIHKNTSAAKSWEDLHGIKPFFFEGTRVCVDKLFQSDMYTLKVTGFNQKKELLMVGYDSEKYERHKSTEGLERKLFHFNNKEWDDFKVQLASID